MCFWQNACIWMIPPLPRREKSGRLDYIYIYIYIYMLPGSFDSVALKSQAIGLGFHHPHRWSSFQGPILGSFLSLALRWQLLSHLHCWAWTWNLLWHLPRCLAYFPPLFGSSYSICFHLSSSIPFSEGSLSTEGLSGA